MSRWRGIMVLVVLGLLGWSECFGALSQEQIYAEFNEANEAFRAANLAVSRVQEAKSLYTKAILHYEKIINDGGVRNGKLYYNLGNAYILKGDVGRAILNYRRAEKLEGVDSNIQKNLAFARSRRFDAVQVKTQKRVMKTLFFWHYDFSLKHRVFASCVCFGLVCVGFIFMVRRGRGRMGVGAFCAVFGLLLGFFGASVLVEVVGSRGGEGVVVADSVEARQGDGLNYPLQYKEPLHSGTEFEVVEQRLGWLHIRIADGSDGWIDDNAAELL